MHRDFSIEPPRRRFSVGASARFFYLGEAIARVYEPTQTQLSDLDRAYFGQDTTSRDQQRASWRRSQASAHQEPSSHPRSIKCKPCAGRRHRARSRQGSSTRSRGACSHSGSSIGVNAPDSSSIVIDSSTDDGRSPFASDCCGTSTSGCSDTSCFAFACGTACGYTASCGLGQQPRHSGSTSTSSQPRHSGSTSTSSQPRHSGSTSTSSVDSEPRPSGTVQYYAAAASTVSSSRCGRIPCRAQGSPGGGNDSRASSRRERSTTKARTPPRKASRPPSRRASARSPSRRPSPWPPA